MNPTGGVAGFVLAGGRSSRMGADKALLPWLGGEPLLVRQARLLAETLGPTTGRVAIVGSIERYGSLGFPVVEDLRPPGNGPLAGIEAALASAHAGEWNLVTACDMPKLSREVLAGLLGEIAHVGPGVSVILARSPRGPEPLCSVYRRSFAAVAQSMLDAGRRKILDAFDGLELVHFEIESPHALANVNTPEDWRAAIGEAAG